MPRRRKRSCYSDEHYVPVLLATLGLDNETTCSGNTVHVSWQSGTGARGLRAEPRVDNMKITAVCAPVTGR